MNLEPSKLDHTSPGNPSVTGFSTMSSAIEFANNYNRWIVETFRPYIGNSVLEIGTGQGNFKGYLPPHQWGIQTYVSVDIDAQVIARAQQRDPKGQYVVGDICDRNCLSQLSAFDLDTILCTNVLEHIANDRDALDNMLTLLAPGGRLLLFVPAFPALYSSMDKLAGHCRRYTKQSVRARFHPSVRLTRLEYFNPIGGLGWWVNKFMNHDNLDSHGINRQIAFFDRYIVPISKLINPLTKSFFGQSLVCVVQKP
jgi:SAM-dependent methyltransferase